MAALIEIMPYDPDWPAEFQRIAAPLREALGDRALRIHHIGSTSVPGLPAKDIIDVQVAVAELDTQTINGALAALGYTWRDSITGDHVPPEWSGPEDDWAKMFFREPAGLRPTNTHIRVLGRANQRYAVLFRDYLRQDRVSTEAYAKVKFALARLHPDDMDAYYDVKDPVCDIIMAGAERWAAATGYSQPPTDA